MRAGWADRGDVFGSKIPIDHKLKRELRMQGATSLGEIFSGSKETLAEWLREAARQRLSGR